jgi:hypothetical protein
MLERATGMSTPSTKGTRETHRWTIPLALVLVLLYLAAAWTIDAVRRLPSTAQHGAVAVVTFASGASYTDALGELTSIGMRLSSPCFEGAIQSGDQVIDALRAQQESFSGPGQRQVVVATTVLTPVDWVERLWTMPGVTGVDTQADFTCPASGSNPLGLLAAPPAERPVVLGFPSGTPYGEALRAATDMGLRLADPCYEAALARGDKPAWHPASQEEAYGSSGSLVVAPTMLTPADWLTRIPGGVTPGPVLGCVSS